MSQASWSPRPTPSRHPRRRPEVVTTGIERLRASLGPESPAGGRLYVDIRWVGGFLMVQEVALGFDIGTTSVKAGLLWLDADGPMEVVSRPYPTSRPRPGWVEQDPDAWITAMAACWAELSRRFGPVRVRSVGICSQMNTHVLVDASLVPLYPAITWQDIRAAAEAGGAGRSGRWSTDEPVGRAVHGGRLVLACRGSLG